MVEAIINSKYPFLDNDSKKEILEEFVYSSIKNQLNEGITDSTKQAWDGLKRNYYYFGDKAYRAVDALLRYPWTPNHGATPGSINYNIASTMLQNPYLGAGNLAVNLMSRYRPDNPVHKIKGYARSLLNGAEAIN